MTLFALIASAITFTLVLAYGTVQRWADRGEHAVGPELDRHDILALYWATTGISTIVTFIAVSALAVQQVIA